MLAETTESRFLQAIGVVLNRWLDTEVLFVVSDTWLQNCCTLVGGAQEL